MELKKIDERYYDDYLEKTLEEFEESGKLTYMIDHIDDFSRSIKLNGEKINIQIDLDKYFEIEKKDYEQSEKEIYYSQYLFDDMKNLPANILLDKSVWAYMNIKVFKDLIQKHYIDYRLNVGIKNSSDEKKHSEHISLIQRHFFSKAPKSKISRTGLRWLWYIAYKVDGEKKYIEATHNYLDPIRAMFERSICNDKKTLKAYIDFIIKFFEVDKKRLNKFERSTVATHISCVGEVSRYGSFEQEELARQIESEAKYIIS